MATTGGSPTIGGLETQAYFASREQVCACGCGLRRWVHHMLYDKASDQRIPTDLWWNTLVATHHDPGDEDRSER